MRSLIIGAVILCGVTRADAVKGAAILSTDRASSSAAASSVTTVAVRDATAAKGQVPATVRDAAAELKNADLKKHEEAVRRVLLDYKRAFENLDAQAAKAIWPSLDVRMLERAFGQLDGLQMRFAKCGVSVSGQAANARCHGATTYRPKDGSGVVHLKTVEWSFDLARDNERWHIVNGKLY